MKYTSHATNMAAEPTETNTIPVICRRLFCSCVRSSPTYSIWNMPNTIANSATDCKIGTGIFMMPIFVPVSCLYTLLFFHS